MAKQGWRGFEDDDAVSSVETRGVSPGKQTLTGRLPVQRKARPPVATAPAAGDRAEAEGQLRAMTDATMRPDLHPHVQFRADVGPAAETVHAAAGHGVSGGGGALPHLAAIQRSFGRHDVGHVAAHVGGNAATATRAMGAEAYAFGDQVAFGSSPDLHTAAHEAAHVVQQRAGVHLKDGVGAVGDAYEQHADQVADKVVRGESAEALLDQMSGSGGGRALQMLATSGGDFAAAPYTPFTGGSLRGAEIEITFTPNDLVVAPKIGLTQTVKSTKTTTATTTNPVTGAPTTTATTTPDYNFGPPTEQAERQGRANTSAQGNEGGYIDRTGEKTNPMYGIDNPASGTGLGGTSNSAGGNGRFGHRTIDPTTRAVDMVAAWMYDRPAMNWTAGQGMEQIFEATALAIEGPMAGTYFGSVEWGARTDPTTGTPTVIPFRVVSPGVPTQQFMASAANWNAQSMWVRDRVVAVGPGTVASVEALVAGTQYAANTLVMTITTSGGPVEVRLPAQVTFDSFLVAAGATVTAGQQLAVTRTQQDSVDLPTTAHVTVDPAGLDDAHLEQRMRTLADEILHMDRTSTDYQNKRFEIRALGREAVTRGHDAVDSGHTHTVRSGETLWGIAAAHLGGGPRWTRIMALNAIDLQDPNRIRPGAVLKMPRPYTP